MRIREYLAYVAAAALAACCACLAMDVAASTPEEYRAFIKAQIAQWTPVVKATGARGE